MIEAVEANDVEANTVEANDENRNSPSLIALKLLILTSVTIEGLYRYIPGPTLLDLIERMFEPVTNITLIYCARAIGQIIGIILGSFIFQWLLQSNQKSLFLFLSTFLMSATSFFISIVIAFDGLLVLFCASGFSMGMLDTGINAMCLHSKMFESTFLCLISCFYGFGAFLSPVLARKYVRETVNITAENIGLPLRNHSDMFSVIRRPLMTTISAVYIIIGALTFIVALVWLVRYIVAAGYAVVTEPKWLDWKKSSSVVVWNLIILNASVFTFATEAISFGYAQMLPSYLVISWGESQPESLDSLLIFLGFFCIGRIVTIFFSIDFYYKSSPKIMLFVSIFLLFCGTLVLYVDKEYNRTLFLIANGVLAIGVSPLFINNYLWLCCKTFITHRSINPLFIMESLAELITPWLLSKYIWRQPENLKHIMLAFTSIIAVLYVIQYYCFVGTHLEKCSQCEQESIPEGLPIPNLRRLDEIKATTTSRVQKSESLEEETASLDFLAFVNRQKVFDDFSEIEKRIQQSNRKVKSAIRQLEYTLSS